MTEYIQSLFAIMLILELANIKDSQKRITEFAPIHIYDYVKSMKITEEMCIKYIKRMESYFIRHYDANDIPNELVKVNQIEFLKIFLEKITTIIKSHYSSPDLLNEKTLLSVVKCALNKEHDINSKALSPLSISQLSHSIKLPATVYDYPPIQFDRENSYIPDMRTVLHSSFYMPIQLGNMTNYQIPSFASQGTESGFQSLPAYTHNYYPMMAGGMYGIMKSAEPNLAGIIQMTPLFEYPQYNISELEMVSSNLMK